MKLTSYRSAFFFFLFLYLALMFPYWGQGNVIAPYRQFAEVGLSDTSGSLEIENRKFSDFGNVYIPLITEDLDDPRSGWLALWSNRNELGRPTDHTSGFSPAYFPSWVISQFTNNPWQFITILSLSTCFFGGFFVLLFCKEIELSPLSGLIGGISLAATPMFMYWLSFPMFLSPSTWSAGALWGVTRIARKTDLLGWGILAFSCYSLLMTGYHQDIVYHAYILSGYGLYLVIRKQQLGRSEAFKFILLSLCAFFAGVVLALPATIDLARSAVESARTAPNLSFFTEAVLPHFGSLTDVLRFFLLFSVPELFGNPIEATYPFPYDGISITPFVIFFAVIALLTSFKQTWGWWLAVLLFFLFGLVPSVYVFGVKYLGFNLSRSTPLGSIMLPLAILVAYGVNALEKRLNFSEYSWRVWIAAASIMSILAIGLFFCMRQAVPIRWGMILVNLILVVLLGAQYKKTRPVFLNIGLAVVLATISYPLMLRQDPANIVQTSPLVEKIKANLPAGSRFAVASPGISVLPPNLNGALGLPSIHSYNSLSPTRYHKLISALGGEVLTYGRWNNAISPDYNSAMFWMSNIGLMLSPTRLYHENLKYLGVESGVHLHKVVSRMGGSIQMKVTQKKRGEDLQIDDPRLLPTHIPSKLLDRGDLLEFEVAQDNPSVLILSQKFHRDWQSKVFNGSIWIPAKTIEVNGVFLGVALPAEAQRVRIEFKPYVRFGWIAHVFWPFLLALIGIKTLSRNKNIRFFGK